MQLRPEPGPGHGQEETNSRSQDYLQAGQWQDAVAIKFGFTSPALPLLSSGQVNADPSSSPSVSPG